VVPVEETRYTAPDYGDHEELRRLAELHLAAPAAWGATIDAGENAIAGWIRFLRLSESDPNLEVIVARQAGEIVGMHWLTITDDAHGRRARIDSLWVDEAHRGHGIGARLKELGEEWARQRGAASMVTHVFYANERMIRYNLRLGFQARQVEMSKDL